jgi:hypothetical protein
MLTGQPSSGWVRARYTGSAFHYLEHGAIR